jgi:uncharacterized protein
MALGLMLVIEGILPLLLPEAWRQTFARLVAMNNGQLRFIGLISMIAGCIILLFALN